MMQQFEAIVQQLKEENHDLRIHCNTIQLQQQRQIEDLKLQMKYSNTGYGKDAFSIF